MPMGEEGLLRLKKRRWWVTALLTMAQPGLGQIYNGQPLKGTVISLVVIVLMLPASVLLLKHLSVYMFWVLFIFGLATLAAVMADAIAFAKKAGNSYRLRPYNRLFVYLGIFVAFSLLREADVWLVKTYIVQAFRIPAASMAPTLLDGDHILVDKLHGSKRYPRRGDVVVFEHPADSTKEFVKRVEGVAGDVLEIRDKDLYLNGTLMKSEHSVYLDDKVMTPEMARRDNFGPTTVPVDSVFVLGDNRDRSLDSRFFGFVEKDKIRGLARCVYFSWDQESSSVRWDRIGKEIR
jgi:signal peptidase I